MAFKTSTISLALTFFGVLAFIFGVVAENKKVSNLGQIPLKQEHNKCLSEHLRGFLIHSVVVF
ncbi:hypothetical protein Sjap_015324 [Stephania japonica]|uniref:Uncharacterized protein n=1 Tax=Stephania japonica TaxID=461633 RepID=A0AAP0NQQ2_9MAGN